MERVRLDNGKEIFDALALRGEEVEMLANFIDYALCSKLNDIDNKKDEIKLAKQFVKMSGHFVIERKRELRRKINEQG